MSSAKSAGRAHPQRTTWTGRKMFLAAAIGSAIGLGNIWRFPYIAYENGGGAFLLPYVVALITAGVPVLLLDYVLGHRFRGSAPLVWRRIHPKFEAIGWVQTGITFLIAIYYAVILAWAAQYTWFSIQLSWGSDPETFFLKEFLHADNSGIQSATYLPSIGSLLMVMWIAIIAVMVAGVRKGTGALSSVFVPVLIILFLILVARAIFLPGAATGLNAFFSPRWSALLDPEVWMAAYGQIFYSLAIGFGIMMTQASYLKRRSNIGGLGAVVGLSNSAFEVLAGIGVFATLGFMAVQNNVPVDEVATSGIGLAFIAFPAIINNMPGGPLFGILFFGSLLIAGFTSLVTIVEVVVSAVQDKFGWQRKKASLVAGIACAIPSLLLFPTTTGLATLDIIDKFVNVIGIVFIALTTIVVAGWYLHRIPELRGHINQVSSLQLGRWWDFVLQVLTPLILGITFVLEIKDLLQHGYGGYSTAKVAVFGWSLAVFLYGGAAIFSRFRWQAGTILDGPPAGDFGIPLTGKGAPFGQHLMDPYAPARTAQLKTEYSRATAKEEA